MNTYFTICSNNYLAQATVLGKSIREHEPFSAFLIILADLKSDAIDYEEIPFEVLPIGSIEPRSGELATKYNIVEFNTCIKPRVVEYLFTERGAQRVIYLDPDVRVYAPLSELDEAFQTANGVLTPHAYTPINPDGREPTDNLFLRFGIYNLGFIALKRSDETLRFVKWWKERTFTSGYIRPDLGQFVDQLYVNLAPILFQGISILRHEGYNVAAWNFHERTLSKDRQGIFRINSTKRLVFFHFTAFRIDSGELPVHHYNRFSMKDRPDLVELHANYNEELKNAGYLRYAPVRWAYAPPEKRGPLLETRQKARTAVREGLVWGLKWLPSQLKEVASQILRDAKN